MYSFLHPGHLFTSEFNDDEDIIIGRSNCVRQTNNSLCYFRKVHPLVQYRQFQAYCTSLYGCGLWLLTNCNTEALCSLAKNCIEFGTCRLARRFVNYPLIVIVFHYSMIFVVDHFIYSHVCSSWFVLDPFCCTVWGVICSQSVNFRPKCFMLRTALSLVYKWCYL